MNGMTVERLVHRLWSRRTSLTALIAAGSVFTGECQNETQALPYAVLNVTLQDYLRSNTRTVDRGELVIETYTDTWTAGQTVAQALKSELDNADLTEPGLHMAEIRFDGLTYSQTSDGRWLFQSTFAFLAQQT